MFNDTTKSPFSVEAYTDASFYQQERDTVFNSTWLLAGFSRDLKEDKQYITLDFAGVSIVVMNFEGDLRAFRNVCSHRFSRLCEGKGKREGEAHLQCPYHGWTYDKEGELYAVPDQKGFKDLDKKSLCLTRYSVSLCGEFVFVSLGGQEQSLDEYLGSYYQELETISQALGECLDCNDMMIQANWKIVVENTLEHYHVRKVHPESLYTVGIESAEFTYDTPHSSVRMLFKTKLNKSPVMKEMYASRPLHVEDYVQHLIFPCMTLATAYGTTIAVQQIIPCAYNQTRFVSYVFATTLEVKQKQIIIDHFNTMAVDFNRRVFDEDKVICEQVQLGACEMGNAHSPLHQEEERIAFFQTACTQFMKHGVLGE